MNKSHKVKATRVRQQKVGTKEHKAGKPYRGANFVAQHESSTKKNAGREAALRKASKKA